MIIGAGWASRAIRKPAPKLRPSKSTRMTLSMTRFPVVDIGYVLPYYNRDIVTLAREAGALILKSETWLLRWSSECS